MVFNNNNNNNNNMTLFNEGNIIYWLPSSLQYGPQLTVHNTGISLLLSTSVWVLLSPPIERRETRPTA